MRNLIVLLTFCCTIHLHAQQSKWQKEFDRFEIQDQQNPPQKGGIVFTGSSSIRMWEAPDEVFDNPDIINRGFGGSEFSDLIEYFDRAIVKYNPSQVVIYSGDNDIANGKPAAITFGDFCTLYGLLRSQLPATKITVISIKPSPSRWDVAPEMIKANQMIRDFAAYREDIDFIDVWSPMIGDDGKPIPSLFLNDELHMTEEGYAIWKEAIAPYLGN